MNKKTHYKKQIQYFDKEFSGVSRYALEEWQKSYIEKIKKYVIDKDYKKKTLMDIGTGTGYIAIEMAKLGMNVIACDLSPQAIENLEKYKKRFKLKNLQLLECNAEEIPLRNACTDYIVCNALLEHLPNEKKAIKDWKRLLRKKGKMLITVPLSYKLLWPFLWPINKIHDKRLGHLRRYNRGNLASKFRLPIKDVFYTGHLLKVIGVFISLAINTHIMDKHLEKIDKVTQNIPYGASNISVLFVNE